MSLYGLEPLPAGDVPPQRRTIYSGAPDGTGTAQALLGPVPAGQQWRLERIIVSSTSSSSTKARVYADSTDPGHYLDPGTSTGNLDVAEYQYPPILLTGETLIVQWTGMSAGARGVAVVQWHVESV